MSTVVTIWLVVCVAVAVVRILGDMGRGISNRSAGNGWDGKGDVGKRG